MLNEGYALYQSLMRCGIELTRRHPEVKEPGKREGLIAGINKRGEITRLEYRTAEEIAKLWTTGVGNHNSFPVIKLQFPLWIVERDDPVRGDKLKENEKRELLTKRVEKLNEIQSEEQKWKRLLLRVTALQPFFQSEDQDYAALFELTTRFQKIKAASDMARSLIRALKSFQTEISYSLYETILIGKWNSKENRFKAEVPIIFDLDDWENYQTRVASPQMGNFASACLFKAQSTNTQSESASTSALSGQIVRIENEKFPNPKLPYIGNSYLFAVNDQTPCQSRYQRTSTEIIPVGKDEAIAIQNSLEWITKEERRDKTWSPIPGNKDGINDLLIAYLKDRPDEELNNAHLLGGVSKSYVNETSYEAVASTTFTALKGSKVIKASDQIKLFALQKVDLGRTSVSLNRTYTIEEFIAANEAWQKAADNLPHIAIPFFKNEIEREIKRNSETGVSQLVSDPVFKEKDRRIFLSPTCPFPADAARITQKHWIRFGGESCAAPGASLNRIYDVFFSSQVSATKELLDLTLQRTHALLSGLGSELHKDNAREIKDKARYTALIAISLIGIFLSKLGIRKEQYMEDTFFLVGRFLSLTDTLHLEFTKNGRVNRDGSKSPIPPRLLGNAHLQIALDNPTQAFALLASRIGVYKAWAQKEEGEEGGLARWALRELGAVSKSLAEKTLPTSTTNPERAQILLGYLARAEKKT